MLSIFAILISTHTDPHAGKDRRQEEKGAAEDEIVILPHWLHEHEFSKLKEMAEDRGTWGAAFHEVTKSQIQLSN